MLEVMEVVPLEPQVHKPLWKEDSRVRQLSGHPSDSVRDIFERGALIGSGTFGNVYSARELATGKDVALKVIRKNERYPGLFEHLGGPLIKSLVSFRHPNICKYCMLAEDPENVYVAMEHYFGQDLFDYFVDNCPLQRKSSLSITSQVLAALAYVHDVAGVLHCDVKPENFIFATTASQTLKLIDFGSATTMIDPSPEASGTVGFCAPEVFTKGCSRASDVFSAGIILFNGLTGLWPEPMRQQEWQECDDADSLSIYLSIVDSMAPDAVHRWLAEALPAPAWAPLCILLGSMLHSRPERRPTAASALEQLQTSLAPGPHWATATLPLGMQPAQRLPSWNANPVKRCSSRLGSVVRMSSDKRQRTQSGCERRLASRVYSIPATGISRESLSDDGGFMD